MLQRYKLRLGDGTVLGVDHEGLKTWAVDGQAMVQAAASHRWYPLKAFLAAERAAARRAARLRAKGSAAPSASPARPLPLVYPEPREPKTPPQVVPAPSEPPPALAPPPEEEVLAGPAEGPREGQQEQTSEDVVALAGVPITESLLEPVEEWVDLQPPAEVPVPTTEVISLALTEDSANEPLLEPELTAAIGGDFERNWISDDGLPSLPAPLESRDEPARATLFAESETAEPLFIDVPRGVEVAPAVPSPSPSPRPSLQVLADDLATGRPDAPTEAWRPHAELPIIPLKPLDHEAPAAPGRGTYEDTGRGDEALAEAPRSELDEKLIRWFTRGISAYDAVLTGWIDRLARRAGAITAVGPTAAPTAAPLESILPGPSPSADAPPRASARAVPFEDASLPILARGPADELPSPVAPWSARPPSHEPEGQSSHEPRMAPPALRDLPILRLAEVSEPEEEADVYETEGPLHAAWPGTKRVVVTSALLAGGLVALLRFESWGPPAGQLGRAALSELDRIRQAREHAEQQRQALHEATLRLPHLAPQSIRLLMSHSPTGILDPPELLQAASDAADRGAGALRPQEAQELEDLRGEWLATLRPSERERIREYDAVRVRRFVFPFEAKGVLELFERGAYALPPDGRRRLQELLAKAIAAGVPASPEAPPDPPAKP